MTCNLINTALIVSPSVCLHFGGMPYIYPSFIFSAVIFQERSRFLDSLQANSADTDCPTLRRRGKHFSPY